MRTLWMRSLGLTAASVLVAAALFGADPPAGALRVFVSADMEGVAGVSTWSVQASAKGREFGKFRELMTQEVNAAIAGAFEAGATEIVVGDSHGDARTWMWSFSTRP